MSHWQSVSASAGFSIIILTLFYNLRILCLAFLLRHTIILKHVLLIVVFGQSLWRSLAPPTFVAGRDRPGGGAPRHFRPATLAPRF